MCNCETSEMSSGEEISLCTGSFLEETCAPFAGKTDLASPENQQDANNSVFVKELENTSLVCGSNRDPVSS